MKILFNNHFEFKNPYNFRFRNQASIVQYISVNHNDLESWFSEVLPEIQVTARAEEELVARTMGFMYIQDLEKNGANVKRREKTLQNDHVAGNSLGPNFQCKI